MADKHEIEIRIDDEGNVSFEVKGVKGPKCLEITKDLEEALGIVTRRDKTSEYYQAEASRGTQVEQRGG